VIIQITQRAARQIERAQRWWRQHRLDAPYLFDRELQAAFDQLRVAAESGQVYQRGTTLVWRVLMPRTRNHVYYRILDEAVVQVVTVWGAVRERGPRLS
jgi:plasmid stabilization system protein ParE